MYSWETPTLEGVIVSSLFETYQDTVSELDSTQCTKM